MISIFLHHTISRKTKKEFVIEIAIPGKNNTDFNIEIENRSLLISTNNENEN